MIISQAQFPNSKFIFFRQIVVGISKFGTGLVYDPADFMGRITLARLGLI